MTYTKKILTATLVIAFLFLSALPLSAFAGTLTNFGFSAASYEAGTTTDYTFNYTIETPNPNMIFRLVGLASFDLTSSTADVTIDGTPASEDEYWNGQNPYIRLTGEPGDAGADVEVVLTNVVNPSDGSYTFQFGTADGGGNFLDTPLSIDPIIIGEVEEPDELILTEVEQIPSEVYVEDAVYNFSVNEAILNAIGNETGEFLFEQCVTGSDNSVDTILDIEEMVVRFIGLEPGNEILCQFGFVDNDDNFSNTLQIGPSTVIAPESSRSSSRGGKKKVPAVFAKTASNPATTTSNTEVTTIVRDLTLADEGDDVKKLQEILISKNTGPMAQALAGIGATGYFGSYTRDALAEYQVANGIIPSVGYFGTITRSQMTTAGAEGLWW